MENNLYKRLARAEAMVDAQRAEMMETLQRTYAIACEEQDEESAAEIARKIRNKLLEQSDNEMSLDRLGLDTSSVTKFIASLVSVFNGSWAVYRQKLRDLPEQDGWPFNVTFPELPEERK